MKKITISPKMTVFILLAMGLIFISLLYYTFETLLFLGFVYLISIPISIIIYRNKNKKILETSEDEHEDVL